MSKPIKAQSEVSREWLASNEALVTAARPSWADAERVYLDYSYGEVESVVFVRQISEVTIEQWFTLAAGALTALDVPRVCLTGDDSEEASFTPERSARVAVSLLAAAMALGAAATLGELRAAAVDAGLSTGSVYAAMLGSF
ncbi:hypothetical protein P2P98_14080 [Microbacterium sp. Kw_RZR3]|uniref:hypothetical protein n=1 Tax=Microbacterium sp. Kw_RZR3 TaxID=3032903 RepID=UPI0023DBABB7|nr:hypothetical protein [Microbacterium sp. Kw_RZR3]MDF2047291.1 hypothetical protein [Microbacterium sp. Kw_RZR3]